MPESNNWVSTEIDNGHMEVTNGDIVVKILADFSGTVESNETGDFFEFRNLRDFIRAAKLLEQALIDHYGGWE